MGNTLVSRSAGSVQYEILIHAKYTFKIKYTQNAKMEGEREVVWEQEISSGCRVGGEVSADVSWERNLLTLGLSRLIQHSPSEPAARPQSNFLSQSVIPTLACLISHDCS